jgi:hypothetical protein
MRCHFNQLDHLSERVSDPLESLWTANKRKERKRRSTSTLFRFTSFRHMACTFLANTYLSYLGPPKEPMPTGTKSDIMPSGRLPIEP